MPLKPLLQQMAVHYDGKNLSDYCRPAEIAQMATTERADLGELVLEIRKAAAVAAGEAPARYASLATPLSRAVKNMLEFGNPSGPDLRSVAEGRGGRFVLGVVAKMRDQAAPLSAKSLPAVPPVSPARQGQPPVVTQAAPAPAPPPAAPAASLKGLARVAAAFQRQFEQANSATQPAAPNVGLHGLDRVAAKINASSLRK